MNQPVPPIPSPLSIISPLNKGLGFLQQSQSPQQIAALAGISFLKTSPSPARSSTKRAPPQTSPGCASSCAPTASSSRHTARPPWPAAVPDATRSRCLGNHARHRASVLRCLAARSPPRPHGQPAHRPPEHDPHLPPSQRSRLHLLLPRRFTPQVNQLGAFFAARNQRLNVLLELASWVVAPAFATTSSYRPSSTRSPNGANPLSSVALKSTKASSTTSPPSALS